MKFEKVKRIFAIAGIVVLVGMYIATFVFSLMKSELAHSLFVLSLYCSFVIPILIYAMQLIYKAKKRRDEEKEQKK